MLQSSMSERSSALGDAAKPGTGGMGPTSNLDAEKGGKSLSCSLNDGSMQTPCTSDLESQEKSTTEHGASDDETTADAGDYPEGFTLAMIVVALTVSLFLVSLDNVSET